MVSFNPPAHYSGQRSSLDRLPTELLSKLYKLLDKTDIKSVRQTSKLHHACSSPFLITKAYFATRLKTIGVFNEILAHPVFSRSVTRIVYDYSRFTEDSETASNTGEDSASIVAKANNDTQDHTDNESDDGMDEILQSESTDIAKIKKSLDEVQWQQLYKGQEHILREKIDLKCLKRAGLQLPNLRSIQYTSWSEQLGENCWYVEKGPMYWDRVPGNFRRAGHSDEELLEPEIVARSPSSVLNCFLHGTAKINKIQIGIVCGRPSGQILPLVARIQREQDAATGVVTWTNFMSNITKIQFSFMTCFDDFVDEDDNAYVAFASLLRQVPALRRLDLSTGYIWDGPVPNPATDHLLDFFLSDLSFPHLHTLNMWGGFFIDPEGLLNFLDRHGASLRNLCLDKSRLYSGSKTWPEIFDHLREHMTVLTSIDLRLLEETDTLESEKREWSRASAYRRRYLEIACRWILGNGEPSDQEREDFEDLQKNWHNWEALRESYESGDKKWW